MRREILRLYGFYMGDVMRLINFLTVSLTGLAVSLVAGPGWALPSQSNYPLAANSEADPPICFMTKMGGTTLNLTSLCGTKTPVTAPATPIAAAVIPKRTLADTGLQPKDFYDMGRSGQMKGYTPPAKSQ
ncbi:MAG: hypothetical protein SFW36_22355 [Leptolyngbyaceae cyanobacterium bins.59]|nr:hypothetical protein [Leptolyngbyaceae cyanobacterium bins.59]